MRDLTFEQVEKIAANRPVYIDALRTVMENPTCFMCRFKHDKTTAGLSFHLQSTHGFTLHEVLCAFESSSEKSITL